MFGFISSVKSSAYATIFLVLSGVEETTSVAIRTKDMIAIAWIVIAVGFPCVVPSSDDMLDPSITNIHKVMI